MTSDSHNLDISSTPPALSTANRENEPPVTPDVVEERRVVLPICLLVATCLSTFWVGSTQWLQAFATQPGATPWSLISANWQQGLAYMGAVMGILMAHEMGHFLFSLRYKIPASFPYFIPVPFFPLGTMGAVIGLHGGKADRRQLFDLGIAGPLAGLVVAIPVLVVGIYRFVPTGVGPYDVQFHNPLLVQLMMRVLRPDLAVTDVIAMGQFNPLLMAGWVGLLVTGLNMFPISQLDGGHVLYGLFGRRANRFARAFLIVAILFILATETYVWVPMLVLVTMMGADHPRTADDSVSLGWARETLGYASLTIPLLCFPVWGIT